MSQNPSPCQKRIFFIRDAKVLFLHKVFSKYLTKTFREMQLYFITLLFGRYKKAIKLYPYFVCENMFYFVVKYFAQITASWTLICCPIPGNHSNIRKNLFHGKYVTKMFSQITFSVSKRIFKVAANQRYIVWKMMKYLKATRQVTRVVWLNVILFRIYEKDAATENEFGTALQTALEPYLTQRFKQNKCCKSREFL